MGGCASKPKGFDPRDIPVSPKDIAETNEIKTEAKANFKANDEIKEEKENGGEKQIEAPLVDPSDIKQEAMDASSTEMKPIVTEPVSINATAQEKPDKKVEIATAASTTAMPVVTKEKVKEETEAKVEEKSEAPVVTKEKDNEIEAKVEGKSDASLVVL